MLVLDHLGLSPMLKEGSFVAWVDVIWLLVSSTLELNHTRAYVDTHWSQSTWINPDGWKESAKQSVHNLGDALGVVRLDFRGGFVKALVGILGGEVLIPPPVMRFEENPKADIGRIYHGLRLGKQGRAVGWGWSGPKAVLNGCILEPTSLGPCPTHQRSIRL